MMQGLSSLLCFSGAMIDHNQLGSKVFGLHFYLKNTSLKEAREKKN